MLRSGMIVETKDGELGMVMLKTSVGDLVVSDGTHKGRTWLPLKERGNDMFSKFLIVKVYDHNGKDGNTNKASFDLKHYNLIWELK